ncbi:MAG: GNAT family N-acetyltransferase [Cyanobacteria bacterium P01_G01_bin.38]
MTASIQPVSTQSRQEPVTLSLVQFRETEIGDLPFVLAAERNPANSPYVTQWPLPRHQRAVEHPDERHWIVEADDQPVGYAILAGVGNPNQVLELRRLVIIQKGKGYGRASVQWLKQYAFEQQQAHRLWLDVKTLNQRAQKLYRSEGFVKEGTLRECIKTDSGYESLQIMALLAPAYQKAHPSGKGG